MWMLFRRKALSPCCLPLLRGKSPILLLIYSERYEWGHLTVWGAVSYLDRADLVAKASLARIDTQIRMTFGMKKSLSFCPKSIGLDRTGS